MSVIANEVKQSLGIASSPLLLAMTIPSVDDRILDSCFRRNDLMVF